MPILNLKFRGEDADGEDHSGYLRGFGLHQRGAIVRVTLSPLDQHGEIFSDMDGSLPTPVSGYAMIDTGAGMTCFDQSAAQKAQLMVVGRSSVSSVTGTGKVPVYSGQLDIADFTCIKAETALGVKLDTPGIIALIGRDVLANCLLVYNGPESSVSLSH